MTETKQFSRPSEASIERRFAKMCNDRGAECRKFVSPGWRGVPDRLLLLPGGKCVFVEFKAPGKRPTALQAKRHDELRSLGFRVEVIDSKEGADALLEEVLPR